MLDNTLTNIYEDAFTRFDTQIFDLAKALKFYPWHYNPN